MKKTILYSLILCTYLYSNGDKEVFIEKYIDKQEFNKTQKETDEYRKNLSKDVDLKEISKDKQKEIDIKIDKNPNEKDASQIAESINNEVKSINFQKKVDGYKEYILNDKDLDFNGKMGDYKKEIVNSNENIHKNKILNNNERLIIAISSSIPDEVIKNYFKSFGENNEDVLFVLNGFIGNDPKKIMPTLEYISKLLFHQRTSCIFNLFIY
jgi:hypothetical protein